MIWDQKIRNLLLLLLLLIFKSYITICTCKTLSYNGNRRTEISEVSTQLSESKSNSKSPKGGKYGSYTFDPVDNIPGQYENAAIATSSKYCAEAGRKIVEKGGSAIDAAIATALCDGVISFQGIGLGGGFLMTIWDATTKKAYFLDAREHAPNAAYYNRFDDNEVKKGAKSVAVPGEIAGYWEAHQRFGKLPWEDLFVDAIRLCEDGFRVTKYLANTLIKVDEALENVGDILKRPALAGTLKKIQKYGKNMFYKGALADKLVKEIQQSGGIITKEDFENYKPRWKNPINGTIRDGRTIFSAPEPGSGSLLIFMINVLKNLIPAPNKNFMWQRIVETFKWAYARRSETADFIERPEYVNRTNKIDCQVNSETALELAEAGYEFLEDNNILFDIDCLISITEKLILSKKYAEVVENFIKDNQTFTDVSHYNYTRKAKDDHGTSHTSVYAPDGSAVSITSTINYLCGSLFYSEDTGIIWNNEMDDYSYPNVDNFFGIAPSEFNFIRNINKYLRPKSSMAPTIILNKDNTVRLVIGGSGGSTITTAIATAIVLNLFLDEDIKTAVDHPRVHHNFLPMKVYVQPRFDEEIANYLTEVGHNLTEWSDLWNSLAAISINGPKNITAAGDYRREGGSDGY